jgi:transketolase
MNAIVSIAGRADINHAEMANALRFLAIDAVETARSGHPGMPMGMADVATVLFSRFLKFDPADPAWPTAIVSCSRPATARCCSMRCFI